MILLKTLVAVSTGWITKTTTVIAVLSNLIISLFNKKTKRHGFSFPTFVNHENNAKKIILEDEETRRRRTIVHRPLALRALLLKAHQVLPHNSNLLRNLLSSHSS